MFLSVCESIRTWKLDVDHFHCDVFASYYYIYLFNIGFTNFALKLKTVTFSLSLSVMMSWLPPDGGKTGLSM